jgi:hypothetical protein
MRLSIAVLGGWGNLSFSMPDRYAFEQRALVASSSSVMRMDFRRSRSVVANSVMGETPGEAGGRGDRATRVRAFLDRRVECTDAPAEVQRRRRYDRHRVPDRVGTFRAAGRSASGLRHMGNPLADTSRPGRRAC